MPSSSPPRFWSDSALPFLPLTGLTEEHVSPPCPCPRPSWSCSCSFQSATTTGVPGIGPFRTNDPTSRSGAATRAGRRLGGLTTGKKLGRDVETKEERRGRKRQPGYPLPPLPGRHQHRTATATIQSIRSLHKRRVMLHRRRRRRRRRREHNVFSPDKEAHLFAPPPPPVRRITPPPP